MHHRNMQYLLLEFPCTEVFIMCEQAYNSQGIRLLLPTLGTKRNPICPTSDITFCADF